MLRIREDLPPFLNKYLPSNSEGRMFVTLTYAQSVDAKISKGQGIRTTISHLETKAMTHFLRYHHDAILIGSGTVLADDPGLNCKWCPFEETASPHRMAENSPRPIIIDTKQKWKYTGSKMQELYEQGMGKEPIVVVENEPTVRERGVSYLVYGESKIEWNKLFDRLLKDYNIKSVMVEGGAHVINQLLARPDVVNSVIVTIGSVYLGENGVTVSPPDEVKLLDIDWWTGTADSILCAKLSATTI
ncbi:2,5-diamino-6-ribosylamino-4(3H)-pyrimidinone 5'-phosphate reductase [Nakaseomyces bracarensis]|uniref:2,5-diamino-6-ribosylamino-4(3H)-pyrimidinone 5'-phosphate reductase n=1 Tax=Nakaseomyces bracarensis TaxID=273131 RepID=A0ABR4NX56_9SACH